MTTQSLKSHMLYQKLSLGPSLLIFWGIVSLVTMLNVLLTTNFNLNIGFFVTQRQEMVNGIAQEVTYEAVSVVATAFIALMIYTVVISLINQPENFSFLIGLGSTRKAFYVTQVLVLTLMAFFNAFLHAGAFALEGWLFPRIGLNQLDYLQVYGFHLSNLSLILVQGLILTLVSAFFTLVATLFYRFRSRNALIVLIAGIVASVLLPVNLGFSTWGRLFRWLSDNASVPDLAWKLLVLTILCWELGWLVVRRTEAR